jgi:hypothetical protein
VGPPSLPRKEFSEEKRLSGLKMSAAEQEINELASQIGLSVAELSHILTRDQWHMDYMVHLGYHPRRAEELVFIIDLKATVKLMRDEGWSGRYAANEIAKKTYGDNQENK